MCINCTKQYKALKRLEWQKEEIAVKTNKVDENAEISSGLLLPVTLDSIGTTQPS